MIHSLLIPYISDDLLFKLKDCCREIAHGFIDGRFSARFVYHDKFTPASLEVYYDQIIDELKERKKPYSNDQVIKWDFAFFELVQREKAFHLLASANPFMLQDYVNHVAFLYKSGGFSGGRLPANPDDLVELFDWRCPNGREAMRRIFHEEWRKCSLPY